MVGRFRYSTCGGQHLPTNRRALPTELGTRLSARTEMFGTLPHRFSPYAKLGSTDRGPIDVRGVISTQFVRTPDGWRISSMAWDDERSGLTLGAASG